MWILVDDVAILECPGLGLIGVADQINRLLLIGLDEAPFHSAGKTGAAASAQPRSFDFVDDFGARHGDGFFQLLVAAVAQVTVDVGGPVFATDVFENETAFERMRRSPWRDSSSRDCEASVSRRLGCDVFVQLIVHHANRRCSAAGQTFDEFDAVFAIRADARPDCACRRRGVRDRFRRRGQLVHQLIAASHGAAQCPANANMFPSGRLLPEHRIKSDQLENVDRLETEFRRNPVYAFVADVSEMFLPEMQQGHGCASFAARPDNGRSLRPFFAPAQPERVVLVESTDDGYSDRVLSLDCTLSSLKKRS